MPLIKSQDHNVIKTNFVWCTFTYIEIEWNAIPLSRCFGTMSIALLVYLNYLKIKK